MNRTGLGVPSASRTDASSTRKSYSLCFCRPNRDPFHVWEQTPPDQRGIDPEVTPPHIMEKMQQARVFVQVDGRWPEGTALRILTDEGVALQVALQGFSDGYDIAVPPGSDWQVQILDGDMNVLDDPQARVNVTQWAGAEAVMVTVTPERLGASTISLAEFGRLRDAASVVSRVPR